MPGATHKACWDLRCIDIDFYKRCKHRDSTGTAALKVQLSSSVQRPPWVPFGEEFQSCTKTGSTVDLDLDGWWFSQRVVHRAVGDDRMQWLHQSGWQACGHDHSQANRGNASRRSVCLAVFGMYR
jgi:hypothetical protein